MMPVIINNIVFKNPTESEVLKAYLELQKAAQITISPNENVSPKETVTIFQRENCYSEFGDGNEQPRFIATKGAMQCMLIVFRGKTKNDYPAVFASHIDSTNHYDWESRLSSMNGEIEISIIGGEAGSEQSEITLKSALKYLIQLSNKYNLNFVVKNQRILADFIQTNQELPFQCTEYVLEKAEIAFKALFNEELPAEVLKLRFSSEDFANHRSSIPKLEDTLKLIYPEIVKMRNSSVGQFNQFINNKLMPFSPFFVNTDQVNLLNVCGFLFSAGQFDASRAQLFQQVSRLYAKDKKAFIVNIGALFTPLGYDVVRFFLIVNGNHQIPKYTDFAFSLEEGCVVPISKRLPNGKFELPRVAKILDFSNLAYFECYESSIGYKKPKLSPPFIAQCDRHSRVFLNANATHKPEILQPIFREFQVGENSLKRRIICNLLSCYAKNRDEFVTPVARMEGLVAAAPTAASTVQASSQKGKNHILWLNKIAGVTFQAEHVGNSVNAIFVCKTNEEAKTLCQKLTDDGLTMTISDETLKLVGITEKTQQLKQAMAKHKKSEQGLVLKF